MTEDQPWYRTYFGPDYLRIYRFADTQAQLVLLRRLLAELPPGAALLDLPCGHGRHAVALAGEGYAVTGVDLSRLFLSRAAQSARDEVVALRLAQADMRAFPLASASFDAAICMFTSLGYFNDDAEHQRVLDEFGRVLRPGSRFVLDLAAVEYVRDQPDSSSWEKDGVEVRSRYRFDATTRRAVTQREVKYPDGHEEYLESAVRLFAGEEIEAMLAAAGFALEERFGSYDGEPLDPSRPRRILVARRG